MRFSVDGWDPSYGSSFEDTGDQNGPAAPPSSARVEVDVECSAAQWAPVAVPGHVEEPSAVIFLDGVRRLEARVWLHADDGATSTLGMAASWAAGAVCCCAQGAHLLTSNQRRGLFSSQPQFGALRTRVGEFAPHHVAADADESPALTLSAGLQRMLGDLEIVTATAARAAASAHLPESERDLLVIDGPLRGRTHLPRSIGFIKSHRAVYLPEELNLVVAQLEPGERTPVFLMGTSWDRFAWYLRLPCRPAAPWTGIVRIECAADLGVDEVIGLAHQSQSLLPRFASSEYKDSRAPQNLVPIAGLEQTLRHRLGDQAWIQRALQAAAGAS